MCDNLPLAISICGGRLATRENWTLRRAGHCAWPTSAGGSTSSSCGRIDKSVRASLQLSYADCTGIQRRLLRLLSLIRAPDVPGWVAGELLSISSLEGADQLEALMDVQLADCSGTDAAGVLRYRLHDLVRVFAREIARQDEPDDRRRAAIERVLSGYRRRAEAAAMARWPQDWGRAGRHGDRDAQGPAADWLNAERLTLVAVVAEARDLELWELTWGVGRAFCSLCHSLRAYWSDWRAVAEITYDAAVRMDDPRSLGIALLERAAVTGGQGSHEKALADAERALEIFTGLGESWWAARAMRSVGMTLFGNGNVDRGQEYLIAAVAAFKGEDDRWWSARTQRNLAELRLAQRRPEEARDLLEEALGVFKRDGNRYPRRRPCASTARCSRPRRAGFARKDSGGGRLLRQGGIQPRPGGRDVPAARRTVGGGTVPARRRRRRRPGQRAARVDLRAPGRRDPQRARRHLGGGAHPALRRAGARQARPFRRGRRDPERRRPRPSRNSATARGWPAACATSGRSGWRRADRTGP